MGNDGDQENAYEIGSSLSGDMRALGEIFCALNQAAMTLGEMARKSEIADALELELAGEGTISDCLETIERVRAANPELDVNFLVGTGEIDPDELATDLPQTRVRI